MIAGLIGKKIGMTHLFHAEARVVPVTVLEVGPCVVTQVRTKDRDGYEAVQIGYGETRQLNKPARGHLAAAAANTRHLREFPADDVSEHYVGERLPVTQFQEGDLVDVAGTTKGRGFQGVMKRHGFGGGKKTHGQGDRGRAPGSIGAGTYPGRVVKGKRMPGHMGSRRVTTLRLRVARVDPERNLLLLRGAVPGARNGVITVRYAKGAPIAERVAPPEPEIVEPEAPELESAVGQEVPDQPIAEAAEPNGQGSEQGDGSEGKQREEGS